MCNKAPILFTTNDAKKYANSLNQSRKPREERNNWAQIIGGTSEGNFLLLKFLFRVMEESNHWAQIVGETSEGNFFTLTDSFQSAWLVNFQGRSLCAKSNVSIRIKVLQRALCTLYISCLINSIYNQ